MPSLDIMVAKLQEADLLRQPLFSDFLKKFVGTVAGSEKIGTGLNLEWESTMKNVFSGYPPQLIATVQRYYGKVMDAIVPDSEVATAAKEEHQRTLEESNKGD